MKLFIAIILLFASTVFAAESCCPYPVRRPDIVAQPAMADFKCSENVFVSCKSSASYLEVGLAADQNAEVKAEDIIYADSSFKATLICNKSNGKWHADRPYAPEYAGFACAYKLPTGVWTYGYKF